MPGRLLDKTLVYVTGKGGVGKTTVAASLGIAAARAGRRTLVCEVAEQSRVSKAFAREGVGATESELDENLWAVTIEPQAALEQWLGKQLPGPLLKTLARSSAFQYFVAAAPGARELITIAKVWESTQQQRWEKGARTYDTVIVDAPASGHGLAMLRTPRTFGDIARVGPIRRQADKVWSLLTDHERTAYVAVALPEEMPVIETIELEDRLREIVGVGPDLVIVNGVLPHRFDREQAAALQSALSSDGAGPAGGALRAALTEDHRALDQQRLIAQLRDGVDADVFELPFLFGGEPGLDGFGELAARLTAAG